MKKTLIIIMLILIILSTNAAAFNMGKEITFNLREGSNLKKAFDKLENLSNDEITFYYDSEVNLNKRFKMTIQDKSYESIMNLIMQLNSLKANKITDKMYYIYPASKESEIKKNELIVYQQTPETIEEIKQSLVKLYRGDVELETNNNNTLLFVKTERNYIDGINKVVEKIVENKTRIRVMEKEYKLTYLAPKIAIEKLNEFLSGKTKSLEEEGVEENLNNNDDNKIILNSVVNEAKNSIILKYDKKYQESIENVIKLIDSKAAQVEVQVSILEISRDKLKSLGIDYDLSNAITDLVRNDEINYKSIPGTTFANVVSSYSNVLSSPKIRIIDREEGNIKIGQEIPIVTVEKENEDAQVVPSVEYRHVGIDLLIKPKAHVKAGEITLDLDLSVDSLGEKEPTPYGDYYKINIKNINTKIRLQNEKTVVIGGLITNKEREKNTKVPILSEIPILGKIFQKTERSPEQSEIIMLITPRYVNSNHEESESVKEIRKRLNAEFDYDKKLKEANKTIIRLMKEREDQKNENQSN
jgi:type II secretory pathway component GspD/PulD (secretin)